MQLFYAASIENNLAELDKNETTHCIKTLRKKVGDTIYIMDGKGGFYEGELDHISGKKAYVQLRTPLPNSAATPTTPYKIHIAIAPTKNIDRTEFFIEKSTEFGIRKISPIRCRFSERKVVRQDRLARIALAATKQSMQPYLVEVEELVTFKEFLKSVEDYEGQKFIAHCHADELPLLLHRCSPKQDALILIGPEGDFADFEVEEAIKAGFEAISLGKSRLRTETAAIAACHIVHLVNQL